MPLCIPEYCAGTPAFLDTRYTNLLCWLRMRMSPLRGSWAPSLLQPAQCPLRNFGEKLGPLPSWVAPVAERISALPCVSQELDQLTVNEYPPGIGLAPHVDNHSSFEGGPCTAWILVASECL
eukprot:1157707-Pelagomonas_calceolata.AAC.11